MRKIRKRRRSRRTRLMTTTCLFVNLFQEDESGAVSQSTVADSALFRAPAAVKAKASSVIMNSLITST